MRHDNSIIVLGAEAASQAAFDSGVMGCFGYPGTPSTEVFEGFEALVARQQTLPKRIAQWGANEKTGFEMALGASYAGYRSMVTMKHVGLNVAMDAFVNAAITGVGGGLCVLVADDPGMHSSQNEQDSRYLADFAHIPCLEPASPQEVYDYTCIAFDISEKLKLPVMVRLVTRLAHCRGFVTRGSRLPPTPLEMPSLKESEGWVLVPSRARLQYRKLRKKYPTIENSMERFNTLKLGQTQVGIITAGMGRAYLDQLIREEPELKERYHRLDIASYPLAESLLLQILNNTETIFVFEEDYPYLEDKVRALSANTNHTIHGRRDGKLTLDGELTPLSVRSALEIPHSASRYKASFDLPARLPRLCSGCGHIDAFKAMTDAAGQVDAANLRFFGDIGCYTLGAYPPFNAIHTTVEMGAGFGMALGAALMGRTPACGIMGDSTFFHSGLPNLIALAQLKANATFVVLDNRTVAMTGGQETVAMDNIPEIAKGAGLREDQIHELVPLKKYHEENTATFVKALTHDGPDLVIFKRECIQTLRKKPKPHGRS